MRAFYSTVFSSLLALFLFGCSKKTETLTSVPVSDFYNYAAGKYIVYQLDSTVYTVRGRSQEVHKYQEKHLIDAQVEDALGRPSWRVLRYLRDSAGTQPWTPAGTYYVTPTGSTLEVIEYNLRFVKLAGPIREGYTWKGNHFLPEDAYGALFVFQNDADIRLWDNTYAATDETISLNGKTIEHVLVVNGIDRSDNIPVVSPAGYGSHDFLQEKYAKGIGLVWQKFEMLDYQPSEPNGFYTGFGVLRSMIDHN